MIFGIGTDVLELKRVERLYERFTQLNTVDVD